MKVLLMLFAFMIVILGCVNVENADNTGDEGASDVASDTDTSSDVDADTDSDLVADCNENGIADTQEEDTDGDGVIDGCDACADTPTDTSVDETGCPIVLKSGLTKAVSRRQHAQATCDLNILLNEALVESRLNGAAPQMVLTYSQPPANPGCAGITIVNGACIDVGVSANNLIIDMTYDDNACVQVTVGGDTLRVLTHIGNVDEDGYVSIDDLQALKRHVFEDLDAAKCIYDTNCDGRIDVTDLQTAKDNLLTPLPSCE